MAVKEAYWKYSLLFIILVLGCVIFHELRPFLGGILGAMTVYVLVRGQMSYLTEYKKMKPNLAASLLLMETILCFLIPLYLVIWLLLNKIEQINLEPHSVVQPIDHVFDYIHRKTGYDMLSADNLNAMISFIPQVGQYIMNGLVNFVISVFVLLFVLFFMLTGGYRMENYVISLLPFSRRNKQSLLHEFYMVVKANAIGVPLLALIQGLVAMAGYYLFGAPSPVLLGFLSAFASIIPIIGVGLVWIPLALYLGISGSWGNAIGLAVYALVLISNSDNLIRFMLQKKLADTHPLITIFGVFIGLSLFGFMGVIFGPLILSIFVLCVQIFKKEYLDTE
ncbi:MAG: AI-2E family transporter [Culturomica sp.]|jgi:predicted PurR-regulated permease PerM|nr:AI-2E family transporter [Culturomica sp.]